MINNTTQFRFEVAQQMAKGQTFVQAVANIKKDHALTEDQLLHLLTHTN